MKRPQPEPTALTRPFWEACRRRELTLQWCLSCGRPQHPPRAVCIRCHGDRLEWRRASGHGRIHSFSVVHRAPAPEFAEAVPYVVALVELDEGVRLMSNIVDSDHDSLRIGLPVVVTFEDVADDLAVPLFRVVKGKEDSG